MLQLPITIELLKSNGSCLINTCLNFCSFLLLFVFLVFFCFLGDVCLFVCFYKEFSLTEERSTRIFFIKMVGVLFTFYKYCQM